MNETMAGLIILCFSVLLVYLLWRVWLLEAKATKVREMAGRGISAEEVRRTWAIHEVELESRLADASAHEIRQLRIDFSNRLSEVSKNQHALARALGYEWKRTDAKEGWERSAVASVKPDAPKGSPPWALGGPNPVWKWYDEPLIWLYTPDGRIDRRKADRRKPTPQAAPKSPPKKPRRAH